MKLNEIAIDAEKFETGDWVGDIPDFGDVRLKVRGLGNADYRRMYAKLVAAVPRAKRQGGQLDPIEQDRITASCLLGTVLLDWQGLEADDGSPLPFSKDQARLFLTEPKYRRFREAVVHAASVVAEETAAAAEHDAGNSAAPSTGT